MIVACFPKAPSLMELEAWLSRREKALEARVALQSAERDITAAERDAASERLTTAMVGAGLPASDASFDAMLAMAQVSLDRKADLRRLHVELDDRRRDVVARERTAERSGSDEKSTGKEGVGGVPRMLSRGPRDPGGRRSTRGARGDHGAFSQHRSGLRFSTASQKMKGPARVQRGG